MWWNGASHFEYNGKSMENETITRSEFPNEGKAIIEQMLASEERNQSKSAGLWERRVNHLSKIVWDRKIIAEFIRSIISTKIG